MGTGQLPLPRTTKRAAAGIACGLCADGVDSGSIIGRVKPPRDRVYVQMGWLCHHCLYTRRAAPRRRDVLVRVFHHLFAATGIGINDHEIQVLLDWIMSDPAVTRSEAWQRDPLDTTVIRMRTAIKEGKPTTWLSANTGLTMVAALLEAPGTETDARLLRAILQHSEEWRTNPQRVDHRRYGSGIRFRRVVLAGTAHPTDLSDRGGPFDLHHAPPPVTDEEEEAEAAPGE